jgi:hypothetical protein
MRLFPVAVQPIRLSEGLRNPVAKHKLRRIGIGAKVNAILAVRNGKEPRPVRNPTNRLSARPTAFLHDQGWPKTRNSLNERMPMSERLATLTAARERMIEDRDAFAKVLAGPPDRDRSERARAKFVELQVLIEAIERAIETERRAGRNGPIESEVR